MSPISPAVSVPLTLVFTPACLLILPPVSLLAPCQEPVLAKRTTAIAFAAAAAAEWCPPAGPVPMWCRPSGACLLRYGGQQVPAAAEDTLWTRALQSAARSKEVDESDGSGK